MRINKFLSTAGVASRRKCDELIKNGKIYVNGKVVTSFVDIDEKKDVVEYNGERLTLPSSFIYLKMNKPKGYACTAQDEKGRKTVAALASGCGRRVWPVGRLDLDSEGLLLMTDDGALTNQLLHPRHQVEKEYLVWVTGDVDRALPILTGPMELDGEPLIPARVRRGRTSGEVTQLSVVIRQGKNRQVRRMCALAGLEVTRLKRIREGDLWLDRSLKPGQWRPLTAEELALLGGKPKI